MPTFKYAAATLPVTDVARAKAFYEGTLDLKAEEDSPGGTLYRVGDSVLFVYPSQFAGTNQATAATLEVEDVESAVEELKGRGLTFEEYDLPGLKTVNGIAEIEGERGAWFKDPDGNIIAVAQRRPS